MQNVFAQLWNDDEGIVALEYLILATILGLGLIVGITGLTAALNAEFTELANAILQLNQSFSYNTFSNCVSSSTGGAATDTPFLLTYVTAPETPVSVAVNACTGAGIP